jgi:hypothetical protein
MAKSTRWDEKVTIQVSKDLVGVAKLLQGRLEDRGITLEFLDTCETLLRGAEAAAAGQPVRLGSQRGATVAVEILLERAATRTAAVRGAILRKHPGHAEMHEVYGVGLRSATAGVKHALAAIDAALKGATDFPTETAAAKILERDLVGLRELRVSILEADRAQEGAKAGKKGGTVVRDDLLRQATANIDDILNAADMEFAEEPDILKKFTDLIPTKKKTAKVVTPAT